MTFYGINPDPQKPKEYTGDIFQYFDYSMQLSNLFSQNAFSNIFYYVQIVPRGKENGIPYSLMHASEFQHSYVFILDNIEYIGQEHANVQISKWASIKITSGQPNIFNSIISRKFSTPILLKSKKRKFLKLLILYNVVNLK